MKFISWNVNGLRACIGKGFFDFFTKESPDVFCMQEIKMRKEQLDAEPKHLNDFFTYWNSAEKNGYSGTAVFSKKEAQTVSYGMGIKEHDNEGRIITLDYGDFYLVNIYTPNSKRELLRLDYRMVWEDDFRNYVKSLDEKKPVVICGDLNVAHKEIDLKNAKANVKNAGFTPQEREKMTTLLESGFTDSFRYLYPDKKDAYTWWSFMANARERNIGWRIDYFLVSNCIAKTIKEAIIYPEIYGSDHCPVGIILQN